MDLKAISSALLSIAPGLATAVLGKGGGMVVSLIEHALGVSSDDIVSTLANNPDAVLKLKALEHQHAETLLSLDVLDRMDARARNSNNEVILTGISVIFILGFFTFVGMMQLHVFPDAKDAKEVFNILSNSLMLILSYWFGSCHNAK